MAGDQDDLAPDTAHCALATARSAPRHVNRAEYQCRSPSESGALDIDACEAQCQPGQEHHIARGSMP